MCPCRFPLESGRARILLRDLLQMGKGYVVDWARLRRGAWISIWTRGLLIAGRGGESGRQVRHQAHRSGQTQIRSYRAPGLRNGFAALSSSLDSGCAWGRGPSMAHAALQTLWALLVVVGLILALYRPAPAAVSSWVGWAAAASRSSRCDPCCRRPPWPWWKCGREYLLGISAGNIQLLADLRPRPRPQPSFPAATGRAMRRWTLPAACCSPWCGPWPWP